MHKLNSCDGIYLTSLDVRFTKACDNSCPFCIERNGIGGKKVDVKKMIQSTIESQRQEVLILGGEPFLLIEDLYKYIKGIRKYVKKIYITTSLPLSISQNFGMFERLMRDVDGLNVSLQHYDDSLNNLTMHSSNPHARINGLLKKMCENEDIARKIRVSINLVKGCIDNALDLDVFLRKMQDIGVKHVKINELQHEEDLYVSFEDIFNDQLKSSKIHLKSPYSHGCQHDIQLSGYNLRITLKRACFCVNENLNATLKDMMKAFSKSFKRIESTQMVLYEDGTLSNGWKQK